jgi:HupE / UreJ protein
MNARTAAVLFLASTLGVTCAHAHETRPAMLVITQRDATSYTIVWKRPITGEIGIHLVPHLSNGWLDGPPRERFASGSFLIESWQIHDVRTRPLAGVQLRIDGLRGAITDAFVRVSLRGRHHTDGIMRGQDESFLIDAAEADRAQWSFVMLGIRHILSGPDHLLFVLGLMLIAGHRWLLLRTITGFTLAHSLTLGIATVWRIQVDTALLDVLIALSIVFLGLELIRKLRGGTSITLRTPMVPAFAFGLLHGLGFAAGLSALDFTGTSLIGALLQFNAGVEIGQLLFVAAALLVMHTVSRMRFTIPRAAAFAPAYLIGISGAAWMFARGAQVLVGR